MSLRGGEAVVEGGPETLSLPDTVQAVIRARLDNLEPRAREVVRVAAAFGREFEHALLADVVGPDVDLVPAIGRLSAAGLICGVAAMVAGSRTASPTCSTRRSAMKASSPTSANRCTRRSAASIERHYPERLDEHAALLAHHFSRAESWPTQFNMADARRNAPPASVKFSDAFDRSNRCSNGFLICLTTIRCGS